MPHLFETDHFNTISSKIKQVRLSYNSPKDIYKNIDKKKIFLLAKSKAGFLIPIQAIFTLYNDDDFSNNFIIRGDFELKDTKSMYAYYILTNPELTIEYISSSCLSIGLSMEIVKKFGIKIYHLIRNLDLNFIDFLETYTEYEEEPKKINWVNPDILYPKSDNNSNNNFNISSLNEEKILHTLKNFNITSKREIKEKLLQVNKMKFGEDIVVGYCFRISGFNNKRQNYDLIENKVKIDNKNLFLYDIINLNFMRTKIVEHKILRLHHSTDKDLLKKS